ncbi:hypothetical protein JYU34_022317 [Plutella xylostella]|uniref:Uncharacterized protein n=1 Tax=Plutella xylostella TaxID=51655 RepID=A0ABQ7PQQ2_PLUXY|nr:hypothetical protein JYU34_022317 [Plutella xylostella]
MSGSLLTANTRFEHRSRISLYVSGNTAASDLTEESKVELGLEIRLFRNDLRAVREEIRLFRTEMSDLRSAMSEADSQLTKMDARVVELETRMAVSGTGKLEEMIIK